MKFALSGLLWIAASGAATAAEIDRERLIAASGAVLKVEVTTVDGRYSLGTSVGVAPGKFLTNCHVTREAESIALVYQGLRWPAVAQFSDLEDDLCLLEVPALKAVVPAILGSARTLRVGQAVAALGYTGGLGLQAQTGVVSALHPLHGSVVIQASTAFTSGASGGGLFDDQGRLVGILTFRLPGVNANYFSTPLDWIVPRIGASEKYAAIAPLPGPLAYWARLPKNLPYFMQAASLKADGRWGELLELTTSWASAERDNAEPWLNRGESCEHLGRSADAVAAYRIAVERDPQLTAAWSSLGELHLRLGDREGLRHDVAALQALDSERAEALSSKGAQVPGK